METQQEAALESSLRASEQDDQIWKAIFAVQGELQPLQHDMTNQRTGSTYASLKATLMAIQPILRRNNVMLTQVTLNSADYNWVGVRNIYRHMESGQWIEHTFWLPGFNRSPHAFASNITYLRRYTVGPFLGLITEEDDDGNAAMPGKDTKADNIRPAVITSSATAATLPESQPIVMQAAVVAPPPRSSVRKTVGSAGTTLSWTSPVNQQEYPCSALCLKQIQILLADPSADLALAQQLGIERFEGKDRSAFLAAIHAHEQGFSLREAVPA